MKKYLISDPSFYTRDVSVFTEKLETAIKKHAPDFLLYRDKENENYEQIAKEFVKIGKASGNAKTFLHQNLFLAHELGADGVHLNSMQFDRISTAKVLGLEVIISTHSYDEVKLAQRFGADYVTYSPIFPSPNKGEPKGIDDLKKLIESVDIKVFALGGIVSNEQIQAVEDANAYGFASIRYFF